MYNAITATILCTILIVYNISVYYFTTMSNYFITATFVMVTKKGRVAERGLLQIFDFLAPFMYSRILAVPLGHS